MHGQRVHNGEGADEPQGVGLSDGRGVRAGRRMCDRPPCVH